MTRFALVGLLLTGFLWACGGSSNQSSRHSSTDQDLQAARMAAIGGCQLVSAKYYAPSPDGATYDDVHAIEAVFFDTPGDVYAGAGPLLRTLLDASTAAAKTRAIGALQRWCVGQQFAPTH